MIVILLLYMHDKGQRREMVVGIGAKDRRACDRARHSSLTMIDYVFRKVT